jgi:hypothetical protein
MYGKDVFQSRNKILDKGEKIMSIKARTSLRRALTFFFGCTLLLGSFAGVQAQDIFRATPIPAPPFICSEDTLSSRYATRASGWAPANPFDPMSPLVPFANVTLMTFDGEGGLVNAATNSANGTILRGTNPGTYTLNEDCRGTVTISTPIGPLTFDLVVANRGTEFFMISTVNRSIITVDGKRVQ